MAVVMIAWGAQAAAAGAARLDSDAFDVGYVGDEPNTASGQVASGTASVAYPGDDQPFGDALEGVPTLILAVEWVARGCAYGVACGEAGMGTMMARSTGRGMILPGTGQFQAWYGVFADHDADGWIRPDSGAYDNVHASTMADCNGTTPLGSFKGNDATGVGTAQGFRTGIAVRCERGAATEWVGADGEIVAYVTPGDWSGADVANRAFGAWNPLQDPVTRGAEAPDLAFKPRAGAPWEIIGRYFAPSSDADLVMLDNSLLQTTVVEAFSTPVAVLDGPRTMERGSASLADVDLFTALNPAVEALYREFVILPLARAGCDTARIEAGCPTATDPATGSLRAQLDERATLVGPLVAPFVAARERDPQEADRSEPQPYLDIVTHVSTAASLVVADLDMDDVLGRYTPLADAEVSMNGNGRAHAVPYMSLHARLGVWKDGNGDGWIGAPEPHGGCPDVHDCGARPDPHRYDDSYGEFVPLCGPRETGALAPHVDGAFFVTLTPSRGSWGTGVYVMTDRKEASGHDPLEADGSRASNPYDDLVLGPHVAFSGPVVLTLTCLNEEPGAYRSYERLVFTSASNLDYAVAIDGGTLTDFTLQGVLIEARVTDADTLRGWVS